jgi:superfamily I DNA/RNA helicase
MPEMIPESIKSTEPLAEIKIFNSFNASDQAKAWTVIHSWKVGKAVKNIAAEIDFVVLVPGKGIVLIEAKGATGFKLDKKGWHLQGVPTETEKDDPFLQVIAAEKNMRAELRKLDFENRSIPIGRLVWLPRLTPTRKEISSHHTGTAFEDYELAFAGDLNNPYKLIMDNLDKTIVDRENNENLKANPEDFDDQVCQTLVEHLIGNVEVKPKLADKRAERKRELNRVRIEQNKILDLIRDNENIYFSGPAGSGKSQLLSDLAIESNKKGHSVLVTCHNLMMADSLNEDLGNLPNVKVSSLDDLMLELAGLKQHKLGDSNKWFRETLPTLALNKMAGAPHKKYSAIIVDEFQDLAHSPMRMEVISKLRGKETGLKSRLYFAGDDEQQILSPGETISGLDVARNSFGYFTHVQLHQNIRQSPQLSASIYKLLDRPVPFTKSRIHKELDDGLEVIAVTPENQTKRLATVLQRLESDYDLTDIRVLGFENETSALAGVFSRLGNLNSTADRWLAKNCKHETNPAGKIRWRSIRKFKGLDQDVIVITDVSNASADWASNSLGKSLSSLLYVGLTRARFKVVVLVQDGLYEPTHNADGKKFVKK